MKKLTVIECPFKETFWKINIKENRNKVYSTAEKFEQRREVDDYHLCGVYSKAKIPVEIKEVEYKTPNQEPFHAIPRHISELTEKAIKSGNKVLFAGGYCMYAPSVLGGIEKALPNQKIGMVWMDAHSDNNIVETTKREFVTINGIPLSVIMGQTYKKWAKEDCGIIYPLKGENVIFTDGHLISYKDEAQDLYDALKESEVLFLKQEDFINSQKFAETVDDLARRVDQIFLMVDMDILDEKYIPAYPIKAVHGNSVEKVMENIKVVMKTKKVCSFMVTCSSFDLYDMGGDITYLNAMKLVASGLEEWGKENE